jgi:hypothetical protein
MDKIDVIWSKAKPDILENWRDCQEAGLPHTPENCKEVIEAFERFIVNVKALPSSHTDAEVLGQIQMLYKTLDAINEPTDNSLLETDERELLVSIIVDIAEAAGVDSEKYDGEPGGEFRNF